MKEKTDIKIDDLRAKIRDLKRTEKRISQEITILKHHSRRDRNRRESRSFLYCYFVVFEKSFNKSQHGLDHQAQAPYSAALCSSPLHLRISQSVTIR